MSALAQERCHAEEQIRALLRERVAPRMECLIRLLDRGAREFFGRLLEATDHLRLLRGVRAVERAPRPDSLAADDERVLATEFRGDLRECVAHRAHVLLLREVCELLVAEFI